ncbi:plasmid pRiA4b ORF-3 family protein [Agromyces humatus]|uniref:Plasmid pRiA4b Orf3-like domain-containing protein n=1 Tax=Agromyces humatus TaxID=279573 RepID=A0ABN2KKT9_9MICO|nr:plasmid pRiA4b ORF-3 family protein [Agromyces humatus]
MTSPRERFRLRTSLLGSDPEIWRIIDVDGDLRLDELHDVIQVAFGWRDSHLHEFGELDPYPRSRDIPRIGRKPRRWMPAEELAEQDDHTFPGAVEYALVDEHDARVASVFDSLDGPLYYWYDFGDSWHHAIELIERERSDDPHASQPPWTRRAELVRGERRGPLEDSGGVGGYVELLDRLADPNSPEHADADGWARWIAWPEPEFDADAFDVAGVDHELALRFELDSDLSGVVVAGEASLASDAAIVGVLERLPEPLRRELRLRLRRTGALAPVAIEADVAGRMTRPYAWLLERVGDGLALTKAGWMPPAVVHEGMVELGWADDWIGESNREDVTPPMRLLREQAVRLGLVRVLRGRLIATAVGKRLRDDPVALWRHLASALLTRPRDEASRDAALLLAIEIACGGHTELRGYDQAITWGLDALDWSNGDGSELAESDAHDLTWDAWRVLGHLGVLRRKRWNDGRPTDEGRAFARAMLGAE